MMLGCGCLIEVKNLQGHLYTLFLGILFTKK